jgi:dihydroflavonol-4-reductase
MRAVITGCSGLLGANLAVALREAGHQVRATRRGRSRIAHLEHLDIEWVEASLEDGESLTRAFDGCDQVFHCAAAVSILPRVTPALHDNNVDGTARVLAAVAQVGGPRLVHTSSTVAIGVSEDEAPCNEDSPWNLPAHRLDDGYATTKHLAEILVLEAAAAGQDVVVVNPGYMFGPLDARPSSGRLLLDVVKGKIPGVTPGFNSFCDVQNVARAMITAAARGKPGRRYILAGHNLSYAEAFRRIAAVAGTSPPTRSVPAWLGLTLGALGDLQSRLTGREPFLNSTTIRWSFHPGFRMSSDRARNELDYNVGDFEAAVEAALLWFRANGRL